jgi:dolichol kinase
MVNEDLKREFRRKIFHSLSLVYLGLYYLLGIEAFIFGLTLFIVAEGTVELIRLKEPAFNQMLMSYFGGIHREAEASKISGVLWTSLGCLMTVILFGDQPVLVALGLMHLALGDAAAALIGKSMGRLKFSIKGRTKSVEGSLACFAACLLAAKCLGFAWPAAVGASVAATVVEALPVPIDDNFWIPLASAATAILIGF